MMNRRRLFPIGRGLKQLSIFFICFSSHWTGWSRYKETKQAAQGYLSGVILPGKRKNMSGVARRIRLDLNVVQQFITDSPWDPQKVMATNIQTMSKATAKPEGVIIVDDTGQEKKGVKSPGVNRQYSGTLGKTGNCQVFVGCWYSVPGESRNADARYWPAGLQLYIPEDWFEDQERCKEAGIPKDVRFQTKSKIGLDLIRCVHEEQVPHCAIVADADYGTDGGFRDVLRQWEEPYVVAVIPSDFAVVPEDTPIIPAGTRYACGTLRKHPGFPLDSKPRTADVVALKISDTDWQTVEWSEGTKGMLSARFYRMRVRVAKAGRPTDETGWLLFEKTNDDELKVYMCWGFDTASLEELVRIAHSRWVIEQGWKQMKSELGFDEFEGRKWRGWHHHAVMVAIAFSYLMLLRINEASPGQKLPPLPQVRRELLRIYTRRVFERHLRISPEEADMILDDIPFLVPE
jgi:SRSO17 transposase